MLKVQVHSDACGQYVLHSQAEAPGHEQLLEDVHLQPEEDQHQLPMEFHASKKAWMTSNLFSTWLYKQDWIFTRQKRYVYLWYYVYEASYGQFNCNYFNIYI